MTVGLSAVWGNTRPRTSVRSTTTCSVLFSLLALAMSAAGQTPTKKRQAAPRMSDGILMEVQGTSKKAFAHNFAGVSDFLDDSQRLHISSGRSLLAFRIAKASEEGGRYRVTEADRVDILLVDCGDSDLGDIFHCSAVRLVDADGKRVPTLSYRPRVNAYQNALGAKWTVNEVEARYRVTGLERGFTVIYESTSGVEYEKVVTPEEARSQLLLAFPWEP